MVRPPTAATRRKQLEIKVNIPEEIFFDLVRPLETGDTKDFEWVGNRLKPTEIKKTFHRYKYTMTKPSLNDKIFRLQEKEVKPPNSKSNRFRRGHGAARLHLSQAAADRGQRTHLLSQVTGNTTLDMKVPKNKLLKPELTMSLSVSTMGHNGNIEWASTYSARTAASLREQMRSHLKAMMEHPQYPTLHDMTPALDQGTDSVRPDLDAEGRD